MHIAYISNVIIPSRAASSVQSMKMCQAFARCGTQVTLFAKSYDSHLAAREIREKYNIRLPIPMSLVKIYRSRVLSVLVSLFYIPLQVILRVRSGSNLVYTRCAYAGFSLALLGRAVIYECHSMPKNNGIYAMAERFLFRMRNCIRVICISDGLAQDYREHQIRGTDKIRVLHDGADEENETPRDDFKIIDTGHSYHVGYIGSFHPGKGVEVVLEAAASLPDCAFHIAGGTQQQVDAYKSKGVSDNVIFYGYLPQKSIASLLRQLDIALLPNQKTMEVGNRQSIGKYTSPLKMFEYMAYAKPIIASDLGVLREVLGPDQAVFAVSNNIADWVDKIKKLCRDTTLKARLGENARKLFVSKYTWKKRASAILAEVGVKVPQELAA